MANPATINDVTYQKIPQKYSQLCWAATMEIVLKTYPSASQVDQYRQAKDACEQRKRDTGSTVSCNCSQSGWSDRCDHAYFPQFGWYGLQRELVSGPLTWKKLQQQLLRGDRHPIIFGWEYNGGGFHFMVAVRYMTTSGSKKVGIWDPLPAEDAVEDGGSEYVISYNNFAVKPGSGIELPSIDMGLPIAPWGTYINVTLQQNGLVSALARGAPPATAFSSLPSGVQASRAILETRQLAAQALADADLPNMSGASGPAIGAPGFPFPVVALSLRQLRETGSDAVGKLLRRKINVVLYPVESRGKVIDNFLMIRSKTTWLQGGYANLTVTRSLVKLREKARPNNDNERSRFYLLSVPALGGFFLGHGTGADARLMSTADFSSTTRGRVWYPANTVLKVLIAKAKDYVLPKDPRGRPR